jgi:hypothetical protein
MTAACGSSEALVITRIIVAATMTISVIGQKRLRCDIGLPYEPVRAMSMICGSGAL